MPDQTRVVPPRGQHSRDHSLRIVTVLFCDIKGSTEMISHRPSESALAILSTATEAMAEAVEAAGGTVLKRMGDGLMAAFGVPIAQPDHAWRACRAALAVVKGVGRAFASVPSLPGIRPQIRIGLNTGEVAVDAAGDAEARTYDLIGDQVSLAARTESAAEADSVYMTEATWRRVSSRAEASYVGTRKLKGFSEPIRLYRLERLTAAAMEQEDELPFVGREGELRQLQDLIAGLRSGSGGGCAIVGEPGVGKSRLLLELSLRELPQRPLWLSSGSPPLSEQISYWALGEIVRAWLKRTDLSWTTLSAAIGQWIPDAADLPSEEAAAFLGLILAVELPERWSARLRDLQPNAVQHEVLRVCRRLFHALASSQSVVLQLDDLQWIDAASLSVVRHILPLARDLPLFLLIGARPDGVPALERLLGDAAAIDFRTIRLAPLDRTETSTLIEETLRLDDGTALYRMVVDRAEGNPFFVTEIIRALKQMGVLARDHRGHWNITSAPGAVRLPDSIEGLILARIDRLDERMREVLRTAAVIGRQFLHRVLASVSQRTEHLDEAIQRLQGLDLISYKHAFPELEYMFKHAVVQETVYASLFHERRRQIHRTIAESLERLFSMQLERFYAVLAFHCGRAEEWERAQRYLLLAADEAHRLAADDDAFRQFEQALGLMKRSPNSRVSAVELATIERKLGAICYSRSDFTAAKEHFGRALTQFGLSDARTRTGVRVGIAKELMRHALFRLVHGGKPRRGNPPTPESQELLASLEGAAWSHYHLDQERLLLGLLRALNLAEQKGLLAGMAKGYAALAYVLNVLGGFALANRYQSRALACGHAANDSGCLGLAENVIGLHHTYRGNLDEALRHYEQSREYAREARDWITWTSATAQAGFACSLRGDVAKCYEMGGRLVTVGREISLQPAVYWGEMLQGRALFYAGQLEKGSKALRAAVAQALLTPDYQCVAQAQGVLAQVMLCQNADDRARELLEEAASIIDRHRLRGHNTVDVCHARVQLALRCLSDAPSALHPRLLGAARRAISQALRKSRAFAPGRLVPLRGRAVVAAIEGRAEQAASAFDEWEGLAERFRMRRELALGLCERGQHLGEAKQRTRGESLLAELAREAQGGGL